MKIWVLFSIECDYNQPANNLEGWWVEKPTKAQLRSVIFGDLVSFSEANAIQMEALLETGRLEIPYVTSYRLEHIEEGKC